MTGTLTIHSSGTGLTAGHSWLEYTPDGGATTTYGTWGNDPTGAGNGMFEGLELEFAQVGEASRTQSLTDDQEKILMQKVAEYKARGPDAWTFLSPCSAFASDVWSAVTGETLEDRGMIISNPEKLKTSIQAANGQSVTPATTAPAPTGSGRSLMSGVLPCSR